MNSNRTCVVSKESSGKLSGFGVVHLLASNISSTLGLLESMAV